MALQQQDLIALAQIRTPELDFLRAVGRARSRDRHRLPRPMNREVAHSPPPVGRKARRKHRASGIAMVSTINIVHTISCRPYMHACTPYRGVQVMWIVSSTIVRFRSLRSHPY